MHDSQLNVTAVTDIIRLILYLNMFSWPAMHAFMIANQLMAVVAQDKVGNRQESQQMAN